MALIDIFRSKPKWLHSDPLVRIEAARQLPPDDQATLASLAKTDADARVRRAAAKRLQDTQLLTEIARGDGEASVRDEALAALTHVCMITEDEARGAQALSVVGDPKDLAQIAKGARIEAIRRAALGRIEDAKALATIAREAANAEDRLVALERVVEPGLLASVAQASEHRDVALAALARIQDRSLLKSIAGRAKVKAVARRARTLVDAFGTASEPPSAPQRCQQQAQLCRTLEALAHSRDSRGAEGEFTRVHDAWRSLGPCEDATLVQRFEAASRIVDAALARLHAEQAHEAEGHGALAARLALVQELELSTVTGEDVERVKAAWLALTPSEDAEAVALDRRYTAALEQVGRREQARVAGVDREARREELCRQATDAAHETDSEKALRLWRQVERSWKELGEQPTDDLTARFITAAEAFKEREAAERAERVRRDDENAIRLTKLGERGEALVKAEVVSFRDATRCLRDVTAALQNPAPLATRHEREALLARLEAVRKQLYPRVQALRQDEEWKDWANLTVQEELCRELEALTGEQNLDLVGQRLREIDERWKLAKEAPKDQADALWERFRKSRDEIWSKLEQHFARQAAERAANLARKIALCEKAESLQESTDWIRTAESLRALQEEWKGIGPIPRQQAQQTWQRFRAACDSFFSRLKAHRQERASMWAENLRLKEALCESAESHATSSDWDVTAAELRRLQEEWKKIGAVRKNRAEEIWQRFRKACDAFFERFKRRDALDADAERGRREALCQQIEALVPPADASAPEGLATRVTEILMAWRQGDRSQPATAELEQRFENARQSLMRRFSEAFAGTDLDPGNALRKLEKLSARMVALADEFDQKGRAGEDLATRLREALATNTIVGQAERDARWQAAKVEVEDIQAAWRRHAPLALQPAALEEQLKTACDRFFAHRPSRAPQPRSGSAPRRPSRAER
jgi:hypothetical protein